MKNRIKFIGLLAATLVVFSFTSCTGNKLLSANFENDAVGSSPARSLPGEPAGDELILHQPGNGDDYRVFERTSGTPPETSKWLHINGYVRSLGMPRLVQFIPRRGTLDNPVYTVTWRGLIANHPGINRPFEVNFYSGPATGPQSYFRLSYITETHRGEDMASIYLLENNGRVHSSELIGRVRPEAPHSMSVFINTESRTFTITGSGMPNNVTKSIPASITSALAPSVYMGFNEPGIGVYQIDNIGIFEGKERED